jgi:hypothetical protein
LSALALFIASALGMGAILSVVALATALIKSAVVQWLLAATSYYYVDRVGALLLIAAGGYLVYYQLGTVFLVRFP